MPHPFIRRAGALSLLAAFCMPQAGALSDISAWAQADIVAAQAAGLMPSSLESLSARGEITRAEFCGVAVNAYKTISGKAVFAPASGSASRVGFPRLLPDFRGGQLGDFCL